MGQPRMEQLSVSCERPVYACFRLAHAPPRLRKRRRRRGGFGVLHVCHVVTSWLEWKGVGAFAAHWQGGAMHIRNPKAALLGTLMLLVAGAVLFVLPPAAEGSEKAFRLVIAIAAFLAGVLKWRRAMRDDGI